ncbi:MAG: DUF1592 domain-containing protein [Myxococcota bacterium]
MIDVRRYLPFLLTMTACIGALDASSTEESPPLNSPPSADGGGAASPPSRPVDREPRPSPPPEIPQPQVFRIPNAVYRNAVVDVLGLEPAVAAQLPLPTDGTVFGFTNHNDLDPSGSRAQTYTDLSEMVSELAVADGRLAAETLDGCSQTCLPLFVDRAARQLFGRPVPEEEVQAMTQLAYSLRDTMPETNGVVSRNIRLALTIILQSPHFLFRLETDGPAASTDDLDQVRRTGPEVARALASSLWMSVPDEALVKAAETGELDDDAGVARQVDRMVESPKFRRALLDFVAHTLHTEKFADIVRRDEDISPQTRRAWADEVARFSEDVLYDRDGRFEDLLLARHTYVNEHNAPSYGLEVSGEEFQRVELDDRYSGLLTMSGWLALEANPSETDPIVRGAGIMRNYLCLDLAPAELSEEDLAAFNGDTVRQRVENGTSKPSCQVCHAIINPLGFALEGFDELGRPQTEDNGLPIDTTGSLTLFDGTQAELDGPRSVAELIMDSPSGKTCFATRLLAHARGYPPHERDPLLLELVEEVRSSPVKDLLARVAKSLGTRSLASDRGRASDEGLDPPECR